MFLEIKEKRLTERLAFQGFLTINDIYDELGFCRTEAGMIAGWRYDHNKPENYISFRPKGIDGNWTLGHDGDTIVLDFNIDGVIFDSNVAAHE